MSEDALNELSSRPQSGQKPEKGSDKAKAGAFPLKRALRSPVGARLESLFVAAVARLVRAMGARRGARVLGAIVGA
ncbi:MAG: hypothetical protein ABI399_07240, partial [Bauldia sp.]